MNRRQFLKGLLATAALAAAPAVAVYKKLFKLHGDGVTNDTEALQALIDGYEIEGPDGDRMRVTIGEDGKPMIYIPSGTYMVGGDK